ncbi:hypothetical protein ILT44_25155 [Microvirga sp. BT689]|uniref:hypothetical protein n=1 Tax=Microvirga arvi TaxID=2778731 RepID=UPI00194DB7AA|nr:hypothetical protein [Microvirga arvi]MBM6583494.1 hypothetical protein [Microvirga arvi]
MNEPGNGKSILPLSWVRHPNGQEGWGCKQPPAPRLLYNADQLAARSNGPVIVCEGEKTADAVARLFPDAIATTSPGGANAAKKADRSPLNGRKVVVCPDANDKPDKNSHKPGNIYAAEVIAAAFAHGATEVHLVDTTAISCMLPDGSSREGPTGWDLADAIEGGWDLSDLRTAIEAHTQVCRAPMPSSDDAIRAITSDPDFARTLQDLAALRPGDYQIRRKSEAKRLDISAAVLDKYVRQVRGDEAENERERSQRDVLVELVSGAELWRDETGDAYTTVQEDGVFKTSRIRSVDCRGWLIRSWMAHHNNGGLPSAPGNQALQDTLNAFEARAQQGPVHSVFVRIGHHQDHVYVDLGDEHWRAVEISREVAPEAKMDALGDLLAACGGLPPGGPSNARISDL